ncbi:MAG: SDR family NAD(P)-dependent oxidoreductase [Hyphomonadaceae bacterium]|nr:SDR family NAD(P)-dependent oxidoreductase [Hyphomonadaceae bacterium]
MTPRETMGVALVTGASRGIGRSAARALARAGYHVVAVARSQKALEGLDDEIRKDGGEGASLVPMDLKDFEAIDRLGGVIYERWGKLDALFANAAILGDLTSMADAPPKMFEETMATNVLANQRLIRSVDRLLRTASPPGRALFVTSSVAQTPRPFWGAYGASKAALEAMAMSYAQEVGFTGVKVNILDPGATRSTMRSKAFPGEDPMTLKSPDDVAPLVVELLSKDCPRHAERVRFEDAR